MTSLRKHLASARPRIALVLGTTLLVAGLPELGPGVFAQSPPINWGAAGKGEASKTPTRVPEPQPTEKPPLPDSGFDCSSETRMSWEYRHPDEDRGSGPREVRRCSRDGLSIEVSPPQN